MNNKWIPVEEKLPKVGEIVLCGIKHGGILLNLCEYTKKGFRPANDPRIDDRVTHWQPLPPPPDHIPDTGEMVEEELSDEGLKEKIKSRLQWLLYDERAELDESVKEIAKIAQQHTNSKLEELEKWVDKNKFPASKEEDYIKLIYAPELKSKITSLKQQL